MSLSLPRLALLLGIAGLYAPASAAAFSDVEGFAEAPSTGGAGGRRFTGSPGDPYTCKVCHEHGEPPAVRVMGLPIGGYEPSVAYEITVDWSDRLDKVAAAVELTDARGQRAGSVRLAGEDEQQSPELCAGNGRLAARMSMVSPAGEQADCSDASSCRQVVYAEDCGAQRLRLLWTAPGRDVGPIWFGGVVVAADGDGTSEGDGATEVGRFVQSRQAELDGAGCSAWPAARSGSGAAQGLVVVLLVCSYWRRRVRRAAGMPRSAEH